MAHPSLDNLVKIGKLKSEPYSKLEFDGLVASAKRRLTDAQNEELAPDSRFDLGYNAAHALALAALRHAGYRSENRYLVFQCLEHTTDLAAGTWRVLSKCHDLRNLAEYQGQYEIDDQLLSELIKCTLELEAAVDPLA